MSADDPAIEAKMVNFKSGADAIMAYQAKPKGNGPFAIVLVCHENRGLTDHIKDVTRRLAKAAAQTTLHTGEITIKAPMPGLVRDVVGS